jgi:hypothetical protein
MNHVSFSFVIYTIVLYNAGSVVLLRLHESRILCSSLRNLACAHLDDSTASVLFGVCILSTTVGQHAGVIDAHDGK